jgi:hypothetical protein
MADWYHMKVRNQQAIRESDDRFLVSDLRSVITYRNDICDTDSRNNGAHLGRGKAAPVQYTLW